jgi:hypothetical protein
MRPRLFSTHLAPGQRRVYQVALAFFFGVFLAMIWPVVTLFSRVRPLILGLPFFLFYLTVLLVASFLVLLGLYLWEERWATRDELEDSR